ncbi:hypothetical protein ABZP36_001258 [Zizania latifolia]
MFPVQAEFLSVPIKRVDNSSGAPSCSFGNQDTPFFGSEANKTSWDNGLPSFGSDSWQPFSSSAVPVQNADGESEVDPWCNKTAFLWLMILIHGVRKQNQHLLPLMILIHGIRKQNLHLLKYGTIVLRKRKAPVPMHGINNLEVVDPMLVEALGTEQQLIRRVKRVTTGVSQGDGQN